MFSLHEGQETYMTPNVRHLDYAMLSKLPNISMHKIIIFLNFDYPNVDGKLYFPSHLPPVVEPCEKCPFFSIKVHFQLFCISQWNIGTHFLHFVSISNDDEDVFLLGRDTF